MKLHIDGTVEGTPQEIAEYQGIVNKTGHTENGFVQSLRGNSRRVPIIEERPQDE